MKGGGLIGKKPNFLLNKCAKKRNVPSKKKGPSARKIGKTKESDDRTKKGAPEGGEKKRRNPTKGRRREYY